MGDNLRPGEAAEILQVTTETIRRWVRAGKLAVVRLPGGHIRVPQAEIDRILMSGERGGE